MSDTTVPYDPTPPHSNAFGPAEDADVTRQAQHRVANDAIADVAVNDVVAREQTGTFVLMGKNFEANADRRSKIADFIFQKLAGA